MRVSSSDRFHASFLHSYMDSSCSHDAGSNAPESQELTCEYRDSERKFVMELGFGGSRPIRVYSILLVAILVVIALPGRQRVQPQDKVSPEVTLGHATKRSVP